MNQVFEIVSRGGQKNAGKILALDENGQVDPTALPPGSSGGDMLKANNLSDLTDVTEAQENLGLGSAALENIAAFASSSHSHAKLDHLTVTASTDLDAIRTKVNSLDAAVILVGTWDASAGTFPGAGAAQAGWSYIVSVAGTVNSVSFAVNDRLIAIVDNASTSTFSSNWFKADYTDQVISVAGLTGAISDSDLRTALSLGTLYTALTGAQTIAGVKTLSDIAVFSLGSRTTPVALTYGASLTPDCAAGLSRTITLTGDCVIGVPSNGVAGMVLALAFTASGASRELTFNAAIKTPTGATYEPTVASGSTREVQLKYTGSAWEMVRNLEFA